VTGVLPAGFGSPTQVGKVLFSTYLLPFEVTSVLLLVAMIGAIVLTKNEKK
jgi:NADH-quinone oxidoreductase subunit J